MNRRRNSYPASTSFLSLFFQCLRSFSHRERVLIGCVALLLSVILLGGRSLNEATAKEQASESLYEELKVFTDVLAIVQRDYVKPIESRPLVEGAIKGVLATLDPHSGYYDPDFYQDLQVQTKGEFGGLGIEITIKDGLLVVVAPMEGSPAERAGIKPGDAIVKIEGKFTKEFTLVDAVKKLRGPKGSSIKLSVMRKGYKDLLDVLVERDNIQVKSVKGRYLGDGFGYVRVSQFMEKTTEDLTAIIKKLDKQSESGQMRGLILDLRNNPGGLLQQAVGVADLFLSEGVIVYTDGRVESQKQKYYAYERGTEPQYPIMVLVNGGSASASEIVSGALKDHGRALIVGTQTFGKGSVQTITPLENGGALALTTALYYTKSGRSLQSLGVTPDVIVETTEGESTAKDDTTPQPSLKLPPIREGDLPGAIQNPTEKVPETKERDEGNSALKKINKTPTEEMGPINPETVELDVWQKRDRQFQRAFELLKTFNIFEGVKGAASEKSPE